MPPKSRDRLPTLMRGAVLDQGDRAGRRRCARRAPSSGWSGERVDDVEVRVLASTAPSFPLETLVALEEGNAA